MDWLHCGDVRYRALSDGRRAPLRVTMAVLKKVSACVCAQNDIQNGIQRRELAIKRRMQSIIGAPAGSIQKRVPEIERRMQSIIGTPAGRQGAANGLAFRSAAPTHCGTKTLKCYAVDVKGYAVDVKGYGVDVKGHAVDVKGHAVDVKGYECYLKEPSHLAMTTSCLCSRNPSYPSFTYRSVVKLPTCFSNLPTKSRGGARFKVPNLCTTVAVALYA
eukprot:769413-Pyramimonas_sp.AAC.1